jgi:glutamate racemase
MASLAPAAVPLILVFDSGIGGLTVFREIVKLRPDARYAYLADDAGFPYGDLADEAIIARVGEVLSAAIEAMRPDCVVIACNTASTLVLPHLRALHAVPFVGTVPAVKPAAALSQTRRIAVLATLGTVRRDYTHELVARFAKGCRVHLVGSGPLAALAEGGDGRDATDVVALACTHYPLLLDRLIRLAPWPVTWLDPAPAIARRVTQLIGDAAAAQVQERREAAAFFTSGRTPPASLVEALARHGLRVKGREEATTC